LGLSDSPRARLGGGGKNPANLKSKGSAVWAGGAKDSVDTGRVGNPQLVTCREKSGLGGVAFGKQGVNGGDKAIGLFEHGKVRLKDRGNNEKGSF